MSDDNDKGGGICSNRLPYLVVEILLNQLDIFALKSLRMVCQSTKGWVEQPGVLRQYFSVVINSESRMTQLLSPSSEVEWCNFIFSKKYKCVSESDVSKFLAKYGEDVRTLEFNWSQEKMQHELRILSHCPNIESLKSNQLCFGFVTMSPAVLMKQLIANWKNIQHFHVQRFRGGPDSPLSEMEFFKQILDHCTELKTVTIPQFSYDYQPMKGFNHAQSFITHVISPLIKYIETKPLESITVPYYGLTDETFLTLAQACRKAGTVLKNVRSTFLKSLPEDRLEMLDIIGSLDGITDRIIRVPLQNVESICFVNPSFNINNNSYSVPALPSLANVEIDFKFSRKSQKSMELFVHRLAKIRRPTVKSLRVTYQPGPPVVFPIHITPVDLVSSFVNLRVLHIKDWDGNDSQFLDLWQLSSNIVELSLSNCKHLTDFGILGGHPMDADILKLQYLRKLSIINYLYVDNGQVNITEMSFIHAFRHMRLKSFHFFDGNLLVSGKSIPLTAIESLWNGTFGSTIEDFILQETDLENCDVILKKKMGTTRKRDHNTHKRKYSDHLFRSSALVGSHSSPTHNVGCSIM